MSDETLDYHNPIRPPEDEPPSPTGMGPAAVIPLEFNALLTRTADHAGLSSVEIVLRRRRIKTFRTDDAAPAGREVSLYVRSADLVEARQIAAGVFARRARVKAMHQRRTTGSSASLLDDKTWWLLEGTLATL